MPKQSHAKKRGGGRPRLREEVFQVLNKGLQDGKLLPKDSPTLHSSLSHANENLRYDAETKRKWTHLWLLQFKDPTKIDAEDERFLRKFDADALKHRRDLRNFFADRSEKEQSGQTSSTSRKQPYREEKAATIAIDPNKLRRSLVEFSRRLDQRRMTRAVEKLADKLPPSMTEKVNRFYADSGKTEKLSRPVVFRPRN